MSPDLPSESAGALRRKNRLHATSRSACKPGFFHPLPLWVWIATAVVASLGYLSANGWIVSLAIVLLPVLGSLLWLKGEPPVLLFACGMQWLQASVAVLYTSATGTPLIDTSASPMISQATWLSLLGVLVLALGVKVALIRRKVSNLDQLEKESLFLKPRTLFVLYLAAFVFFALVSRVAYQVPSLMQPLLATTTLHWVLVFLLGQSVFSQRRGYGYLALMIALEVSTGVLGYFSGFKNVFLILFVVLLMSTRERIAARRVAVASVLVALLLIMGAVWTVVKDDYRDFLNQGTGMQAVLVPVPERAKKLEELLLTLNRGRLSDGLDRMLLRLSYVNFFALCLANVPDSEPHANGELWLGAVNHVLMPRFLFPNKPAISDSDRTRKYTGMHVAGGEEGTSIGIGYMAESYVDFGKYWMFAPIFILGIFTGLIYRYFSSYRLKLLGMAMATAILIFGASAIETSNIKIFGGNLMAFIVLALFAKIAGDFFWRMIASPSPANSVSRHGRSRLKRQPRPVGAGPRTCR